MNLNLWVLLGSTYDILCWISKHSISIYVNNAIEYWILNFKYILTEQAIERGLPHVAGDVVSAAVVQHSDTGTIYRNRVLCDLHRRQTPDDAGSWGQFALSRISGVEASFDWGSHAVSLSARNAVCCSLYIRSACLSQSLTMSHKGGLWIKVCTWNIEL